MHPDNQPIEVALRPWAEGDLALLLRLLTDPVMMKHLGGPEHPEQVAHRHQRYLDLAARGEATFAIVVGPEKCAVGWVGYWEHEWRDDRVLEAGWSVLPEYQGQGIATRAAALLIEHARVRGTRRWLHAFPGVANAGSNGICRRLGFTFLGEVDVEYPVGHPMRSNDWRLDLSPR